MGEMLLIIGAALYVIGGLILGVAIARSDALRGDPLPRRLVWWFILFAGVAWLPLIASGFFEGLTNWLTASTSSDQRERL